MLAAGGLAGAGIVAARSRRKRDEDEIAEITAERATRAPATPAVLHDRQPAPAPATFAMPAAAVATGPVPAGAEREALLQRMVAAPPDETNPFTSPRSRRKRARLILQHRAHLQETQGQDAQGADAFDWRTYRSSQTSERVVETAGNA